RLNPNTVDTSQRETQETG
nr:hypothetical protein [Tanacetum cinerariifolium]